MNTNHGDFCKHYQAMSEHDQCKLAIAYKAVRADAIDRQGWDWPCFNPKVKTCERAVYPTPEEIEAHIAKIRERAIQFFKDIDAGTCPHCNSVIAEKKQIGRCVYAFPCGCRLYQGRLK